MTYFTHAPLEVASSLRWCVCPGGFVRIDNSLDQSQEFVKETYFNSERELISDQPAEIVEQKERIISVTPKDPCGGVTGNEYGIQGFTGIPRSRRGSMEGRIGQSGLPTSRRGSGQELF